MVEITVSYSSKPGSHFIPITICMKFPDRHLDEPL